jgi:trans-2,3-dihydro-3-hydroxyanthranilate isomerase
MPEIQVPFHTLDVFTDRRFGGNPLAVFPDAIAIPEEQFQWIAREFNLSETVFVLPPLDPRAARRVRIFTPGRELPFAGHPTVGTGFLLADLGLVPLTGPETTIALEEGVGLVPVTIRAHEGRPVFSQLTTAMLPEKGPAPPPRAAIAAVLSLSPDDIVGDAEAHSCGVPFTFVTVRDLAALSRARVDLEAWHKTMAATWAPEIYVMADDALRPRSTIRARMFAPEFGIMEDPATGSAAAALAGRLFGGGSPPDSGVAVVEIEQGVEMGRPSRLVLEVRRTAGRIESVKVGGESVRVMDGTFRVEP